MTSKTKYKPSLWFWLLLSGISLVSFVLMGLQLLKYTPLSEEAEHSQNPLVQQRNRLLAIPKTLKGRWLKTLNPLAKKIQGDLVWNNTQQKGIMSFTGLPKLSEYQYYHLWIYDLENSVKKPISATLFQTNPHLKKSFLVEILPDKRVKTPYKFVLVLETKGQADQTLLLAQP
ncbi:MAG: hypothetical protein KAG28_05910 [Cocleimonas sp.]|nr:hypothetical protein [Cocleimonas sp.]